MRLLLTARDAGSSGHVHAILEEIARRPALDASVYADEPAFTPLARDFPRVTRFSAGVVGSSGNAAELVAEACATLRAERPDALLASVSHFHEVGVDEAFLAAAAGLPRFGMQDYWGDVNLNLGIGADLYFALDEAAVRLTESRHGCPAMACGSPKHSRYARLDVAALRAQARARLGVAEPTRVVGYFGQSLWHLPGYSATLADFARAVKAADPAAAIFYRPHPREDAEEAARTVQVLGAAGAEVVRAPEGAPEEWLAAADVVVSCFSSCAYDAAFLARASPAPLGTSVYLLCDDSVARYFRKATHLEVPPPAELGLAICVSRAEVLAETLRLAMSDGARADSWRRARKVLPDPANAASAILDEIERRATAR